MLFHHQMSIPSLSTKVQKWIAIYPKIDLLFILLSFWSWLLIKVRSSLLIIQNWVAFSSSNVNSIIICKSAKVDCYLPKNWFAFHFIEFVIIIIDKSKKWFANYPKLICFFIFKCQFYHSLQKCKSGLLFTQKVVC